MEVENTTEWTSAVTVDGSHRKHSRFSQGQSQRGITKGVANICFLCFLRRMPLRVEEILEIQIYDLAGRPYSNDMKNTARQTSQSFSETFCSGVKARLSVVGAVLRISRFCGDRKACFLLHTNDTHLNIII